MSDSIGHTLQFHTHGCKVNTYDTGLLQQRLADWSDGNADDEISKAKKIHVINTCAVTDEASKEAVRLARQTKRKEPESFVVITGCAAQVDTEKFNQEPSVDLVVANSHKGQMQTLLSDMVHGRLFEKVHKSNIFRKEDLEAGGGLEEGHSRSFLKIQDGCNSFCTYCVIPFARGKSRSLTIDELVRRVRELEAQGIQEVVLTGIHIGDYEDLQLSEPRALEDLIEHILLRTKIPRIRLTSLEPPEVTDRLLDLYQDSRLCRHFHVSVQSASTSILKLMKRKYDAESVKEALSRINHRVPGAFIGMDVITGFPQETEQNFLETYQLLNESPWTRIHVFPFSSRPGTKAANLENQIDNIEKIQRSKRLRSLSHDRLQLMAQKQIGQKKNLLLLNKKKWIDGTEYQMGLSRDYWNVWIKSMPGHQNMPEVQNKNSVKSEQTAIIETVRFVETSGTVELLGVIP